MEITTRIPLKTTSSFVQLVNKIYCIIMGGEFFLTQRALFMPWRKRPTAVAYEGLFTISLQSFNIAGAPILVEVLKICSPSSLATFYKGEVPPVKTTPMPSICFIPERFQALINKAKISSIRGSHICAKCHSWNFSRLPASDTGYQNPLLIIMYKIHQCTTMLLFLFFSPAEAMGVPKPNAMSLDKFWPPRAKLSVYFIELFRQNCVSVSTTANVYQSHAYFPFFRVRTAFALASDSSAMSAAPQSGCGDMNAWYSALM